MKSKILSVILATVIFEGLLAVASVPVTAASSKTPTSRVGLLTPYGG